MSRLITAATTLPVTIAEAFAQLSLDLEADAAQTDLVERLIRAATEFVATAASVRLQPEDLEQRLDAWPCGEATLDSGPVRDIDEIAYLDEDGAEQTLGDADWSWEPTAGGGIWWLSIGFSAPVLATRPGAVRVRFAAGFNDPATSDGDPRLDLPETARTAVLILVAYWFFNREAMGDTIAGAERLIDQLRVFR